MQISTDRILTTHVGSLPRNKELNGFLLSKEYEEPYDEGAFEAVLSAALDHAVSMQAKTGIDICGDGELPRIGFSIYAKDRMTGFDGFSKRNRTSDLINYPQYSEMFDKRVWATVERKPKVWNAPEAVGRVTYDPQLSHARRELDGFEAALQSTGRDVFADSFVTAASPGVVSTTMLRAENNPAYPTDRDYVLAVAKEMKLEYDLIVSRGHILQLDAPDLAMDRQSLFRGRPLADFLDRITLHIEALNIATADIPQERIRLHVCWGNWDGPHTEDVELEAILPILYEAHVGAISLACANPRHQHEYKTFKANPPPPSMSVIPGVIDVTTNFVEHPEVVAERICLFADALGDRERVIAGCDCGFGTFAGYQFVSEDVMWSKLGALVEGSKIATKRLWG
jgi:5-methyltetrahydropteroyltriglutamate--homocysteine methyltransferase